MGCLQSVDSAYMRANIAPCAVMPILNSAIRCGRVHVGAATPAVLNAMDMDAAAGVADEAMRLLLDAGYGDGRGGLATLLTVAGGSGAHRCSFQRLQQATGTSSSEKPSPWCGGVATAIKLAAQVTRRLRRSCLQAAVSGQQRPDQPTRGSARQAGGAAAAAVDTTALLGLLHLGAAAVGSLHSSSDALVAPIRADASRAVSPTQHNLMSLYMPSRYL